MMKRKRKLNKSHNKTFAKQTQNLKNVKKKQTIKKTKKRSLLLTLHYLQYKIKSFRKIKINQ